MTENVGLCDCGKLIEQQVLRQVLGPFTVEQRRTVCLECAFAEWVRTRACTPRPYRLPLSRPTKAGAMPPALIKEIRKGLKTNAEATQERRTP